MHWPTLHTIAGKDLDSSQVIVPSNYLVRNCRLQILEVAPEVSLHLYESELGNVHACSDHTADY